MFTRVFVCSWEPYVKRESWVKLKKVAMHGSEVKMAANLLQIEYVPDFSR
jgi:hypothetical protein